MAQLPHVEVGEIAADLTDGLDAGCYLAQVRLPPGQPGIYYATATSAPSDLDDWFDAQGGEFVSFVVADEDPVPTWAVSATPGLTVAVSLASI